MNICVLGDECVGKTSFINRHINGDYNKTYNPSQSIEQKTLRFNTSCGQIQFNITIGDTGKEKLDGAIIMYDVTFYPSYDNLIHWYNQLPTNDIPIVLVGNKVEMEKERTILPNNITFHREHNLQYYDISVKSNYNFEKPFLYLARKFIQDDKLVFIEGSSIIPPTMKK